MDWDLLDKVTAHARDAVVRGARLTAVMVVAIACGSGSGSRTRDAGGSGGATDAGLDGSASGGAWSLPWLFADAGNADAGSYSPIIVYEPSCPVVSAAGDICVNHDPNQCGAWEYQLRGCCLPTGKCGGANDSNDYCTVFLGSFRCYAMNETAPFGCYNYPSISLINPQPVPNCTYRSPDSGLDAMPSTDARISNDSGPRDSSASSDSSADGPG